MAFVRACALTDLTDDEALGVVVEDQALALARDGDEVFAVEDLCSHAEVALSEGEVSVGPGGACTIECWLHGSSFDLRSGKPTSYPATEPVATFPVDVRPAADGGHDVYVDVTETLNGVTPG